MDHETVYSTDDGDARKKEIQKRRRQGPPSGVKNDGVIRIQLEKKGRGGKTVTVVYGLPDNNETKALAKSMKKACGAGGTVKGGIVEIQGDVAHRIEGLLTSKGFTVKRAGG